MKKTFVIILVCLGLGVLCVQAQQKQKFLGLGYLENKYLALITNDGRTLDILDLSGLKIASRSFSEKERALSFALHNYSIFIGRNDGNVSEFLFQPASAKGKLTENEHFKVSNWPITALTYSGGILTAGDTNGKIARFSIKKPRTEKIVGGYPKTAITHLAQTSVGTVSLADNNMRPRVWRENKIAGLLNADSPQGLVAMNNKAAIYTTETVLLFSVVDNRFVSGKTVKLPPNTAPVTGGGFSTDNLLKHLLLSTQDGALIVNTGTGEVVAQHRGLGPSAAAWRPDNRQYAIWSDNRIRFYDAPDRPVAIVSVVSDLDADLLIKGANFEPTTIQLLNGVSKNLRIDTGPVDFSLADPKSGKIVSADSNIEVRRLDLVENQTVSLVVKKNEPAPVQQSPAAGKVVVKDSGSAIPAHTVRASGDVILAGFGEKTAIIDLGKGAVSQLTSPAVPAAMDISSDSKHVFLACGNKLQTYTVAGRESGRLEFDADIKTLARLDGPLAAVGAGSCLYIVDGLEGKIRFGPINFGAEISTLAAHQERIAAGGVNGDVMFANSKTGQFEARILGLRTPAVTAVCWIEGNYIAASYADGLTLVVNASSGTRTIDSIRGPGPVRTLSTNGNRLCIAYDNAIHVVDLSSGLAQEFPGAKSAAFWSGQANRLAVTGKNGVEFYIGNTKSGEFRLYPTGDWLLVSTPLYNYSYSYYMTSTEASEDGILEVQDFYEKKTRPITADERTQFRSFKELIRSLGGK